MRPVTLEQEAEQEINTQFTIRLCVEKNKQNGWNCTKLWRSQDVTKISWLSQNKKWNAENYSSDFWCPQENF